MSSGGACLSLAINNVAEYHNVIGLLTEVSSLVISYLIVYLDSQLVVFHLNHVYSICDPILLRLSLRTRKKSMYIYIAKVFQIKVKKYKRDKFGIQGPYIICIHLKSHLVAHFSHDRKL